MSNEQETKTDEQVQPQARIGFIPVSPSLIGGLLSRLQAHAEGNCDCEPPKEPTEEEVREKAEKEKQDILSYLDRIKDAIADGTLRNVVIAVDSEKAFDHNVWACRSQSSELARLRIANLSTQLFKEYTL